MGTQSCPRPRFLTGLPPTLPLVPTLLENGNVLHGKYVLCERKFISRRNPLQEKFHRFQKLLNMQLTINNFGAFTPSKASLVISFLRVVLLKNDLW